MKTKRYALLLAGVMGLSALTSACAPKEKTAENEAPYDLVWYQSTTPTRDNDLVFEEVSKMTMEKINATVTCVPIVYSEYAEKLRMLMASNEKMDLCASSIDYATQAADGSYYPLTELLDTHGQEIKKLLPDYAWKAVTVGGEIYAVPSLKDWPTHWVIWYYEKYANKYGFDMQAITSLEELEPVLQTIKDNEPDILPIATTGNTPLDIFLPFEKISGAKILGFNHDDYSKIVNIYETEEYKEFFELMRSWYQKGFFRKDAATQKNSQDLIKTDKVFSDYGATIPCFEDSRNYGLPEERHTKFAYNLSSPYIDTSSILGSVMSIYAKSENPEKAMDFLSLLFTDKDVLNTVVYGIEGTHYFADGENRYKLPEGATGTSQDDYFFPAYTQGNRFLLRLHEQDPEDKWEQYKEFNESAEVSPALGFVFDATPVMNEITAINNVYSEYITSLLVGAVDPDTYLPQAIEKLKAAGSERVVEEAQKQYDEWKKNN